MTFLDVVSKTDDQDALKNFIKATNNLKDHLPDDMKEDFNTFVKTMYILICKYAESAWKDSIKKSRKYGRIIYDQNSIGNQ